MTYLSDMKYIITESQYDRVISKMGLLNEQDESKILDYIKPYLDSKSVTIKYIGSYLMIDVQSPEYFGEFGFGKGEGLVIKDKLRKNGFMSIGVGEYIKKIK
jgi:hypothetical protein